MRENHKLSGKTFCQTTQAGESIITREGNDNNKMRLSSLGRMLSFAGEIDFTMFSVNKQYKYFSLHSQSDTVPDRLSCQLDRTLISGSIQVAILISANNQHPQLSGISKIPHYSAQRPSASDDEQTNRIDCNTLAIRTFSFSRVGLIDMNTNGMAAFKRSLQSASEWPISAD